MYFHYLAMVLFEYSHMHVLGLDTQGNRTMDTLDITHLAKSSLLPKTTLQGLRPRNTQ